jgi:MFS family permease
MRTAELSPSPPVARAGGQLRAGLAYTWSHPDLVLAMALAFVIGTFGFNYQVTIALMSRQVFDLGAEAFGLLSTCFAVGSLCGALLSTRRSVRPRQRFLIGSAVVFGVFTVIAGLMPTYLTFAVLLIPTGAAALVFSVANNSFVQLGVDPQMRGRVMALYFMCFLGGTPVGAPLIGWISEHLGAPWGLILGGAVVVVAAVAAAAYLARGRRVRLEAGVTPPRLRLRVGPAVGAVASARLRTAEQAVAERAPGQQVAGG